MKNDLFLYLKKSGNCWCMDNETYFRFIKHVRLYFSERIYVSEEIYRKLTCVEIPLKSMDILCFIFGGYCQNNKEMVLVEFFPKDMLCPWGKSFLLILRIEGGKSISVLMDLKQRCYVHSPILQIEY